MAKTKENIEYYLDPKNDKDYLQDLLLNIKEAQAAGEQLNFKILEAKDKGFVVKISGLFAYVSYYHMPWRYNTVDYWKAISGSLVNKVFKAKVYRLQEDPISIRLDAKSHIFKEIELKELNIYRGIILSKKKSGLLVDMGSHFNWKYGSFMGHIHKASLGEPAKYENAVVGNAIETTFWGYTKGGKLILGDDKDHTQWHTPELQDMVGTIQQVKVIKRADAPLTYSVLNKGQNYKAHLPITKLYYPNTKASVKKIVAQFKDGQSIPCLVVKIQKRAKNYFVLKLVVD
ncbi:MAG: hypothetical protein VYB38_12690 [Bacteroidota bacterium]|nr:hypothetical protein [Bacteroidota bacterium]